jgi:hypothetical protein
MRLFPRRPPKPAAPELHRRIEITIEREWLSLERRLPPTPAEIPTPPPLPHPAPDQVQEKAQ